MAPVIGIDLGTTNTVVGVVQNGQASAIADENGRVLLPSVVSFHPSGNVLVGRPAKERRLVDSINTIYSIKRLIGRAWDSVEVTRARSRFPFQMREGPGQAALVLARGETYTLPEISAFVLRRAKSMAEAALGTAVDRAVITVPANFNDLQRAATKVAGRVAGLEVIRILNEPTAAALAYGYGKANSGKLAVYDFGGGTFDVTLLDLSDNVFEVLATAGNTFLGGDDVDLAIAERMADAFLVQHRYDPRSDTQIYEHLKVAAETVKHRLSEETTTTIDIADIAHGPGGKPLGLRFTMSRGDLEQLLRPIVESTFDVCREALNIARLEIKDFRQVLLVGGSTRIPFVKQRVEAFWQTELRHSIRPDEVVAIGAAIQASALSGAERRRGAAELPAPPPARAAAMPPAERTAVVPQRKPAAPALAAPPQPPAARPPVPGFRPRMDTVPDPYGMPSALSEESQPQLTTSIGLSTSGPAAKPPALAAPTSAPGVRALAQPMASSPALALAVAPNASDEETTAVGAPSTGDLERVRDEAVALFGGNLRRRAEPPAPALAPPAPLPPPNSSTAVLARPAPPAPAEPRSFEATPATAPLTAPEKVPSFASGFGLLDLGVPPIAAPAPPPPPPLALAPPPTGGGASFTRTAPIPVSLDRSIFDPTPAAAAAAGPAGVRSPVLVDVTPLTLAVETVHGFCDPIIARNTSVPCERTREFATAADQQTSVKVRVSQGESGRFRENTLLGEIELSGLRAARRGDVRIAVSFILDASGMLVVRARDVGTGRETTAQVRLVGLPDAEEVERMASRQLGRGL